MEEAWPTLVDALVAEKPQRRARLLWTSLAWINGPWIAYSAIAALNIEGESWSFRLGVLLACAAYTLVPSLLFVPAYALWRAMERRRRPVAPPPLQLNG